LRRCYQLGATKTAPRGQASCYISIVPSATENLFPFAALVGQDAVRQALVLLAVNPRLQGLLIRGEKGTAKSTAARGLARVLPSVKVNAGCPFGCPAARPAVWCTSCRERQDVEVIERAAAFETLPLGITEDQLLGTLDLEHALREGERRFEPGLLARANQGVLYVDEVNLLEDHLVDLLLDVAATGVNVVAREGVSMTHPAEFLLVGTMNPEEGDLRPQLLDRFGLCVELASVLDPGTRAEIVARCLDFERDPKSFSALFADEQRRITASITGARALLDQVEVERSWMEAAARLSLTLGVQGHRADILVIKAAATLAALDGRTRVSEADFETGATLAYPHRLRLRPFEQTAITMEELREQARAALEKEGPAKKARG